MTRNKKIIIGTGALLALILVVIFARSGKNDIQYETEIAEPKNVQQTVSVTGDLVSEEEINLNFETSGRIKSVDVFVGKEVAQGDVIATVDEADFGQQLKQAEAALEQAIAAAGVNDDAIREAKQTYEDSEDYVKMVEELEDQRVDAAEQAYDDAVEYYDSVKEYYDQEVSDHGDGSPEEKYAKISLQSALQARNSAEEGKATAKKSRELNIQSAKNSENSASERLKSAKSEYVRRSNNSAVESARAAYNLALMNLDKTALKAPANGTITQLTYEKGEVLGSASFDMASSATTAFARMISSDFIIESQIPESDIIKIKTGQSATITFDAFEESEVFNAEVVEVEPAATVISDVVYYKVKLRLADLDSRLKSGMSADIDIHTAEKKNVIAIPQRAIKDEGGKLTVDLLDSQRQISTVEVETGLRGDDGLIEITSGLLGGEKVVTFVDDGKK